MWNKLELENRSIENFLPGVELYCNNCENKVEDESLYKYFCISYFDEHGINDYLIGFECTHCRNSWEMNTFTYRENFYYATLSTNDVFREHLHAILDDYYNHYDNSMDALKSVIEIYREGLQHEPYISELIYDYWENLI